MLYLNKAEIIRSDGVTVSTPRFSLSAPSVIRLFHLVTPPHRQVPLSRKYILMRDRYTCQYCGKQEAKNMTVDHVLPRALGGKSTWENLVCACRQCNNRKNDRYPHDANMKLLSVPKRPHYKNLLYIHQQGIPEEWLPYIDEEN
jgi:5-methylcytosine-specific restriction endonuclease McrA